MRPSPYPMTYDIMTYDIMNIWMHYNDVMTFDVTTYDVMTYDIMTYDVMTSYTSQQAKVKRPKSKKVGQLYTSSATPTRASCLLLWALHPHPPQLRFRLLHFTFHKHPLPCNQECCLPLTTEYLYLLPDNLPKLCKYRPQITDDRHTYNICIETY